MLSLFTRSSSQQSAAAINRTYKLLLVTLAAQIFAIPETAFDAELPEMDVWFMEELEELRGVLATFGGMDEAWNGLRSVAKERFNWDISDLHSDDANESDEEEGEYAPVVVET
jgi:A1 cistron-splicing factor AAR2